MTTVQGKAEPIRIVVVGHSHVGKTMLVRLFTSGEFEDRCHPSMSSGVYHKTFELDGRSISLQVVDVPGLTSIPNSDLTQGAGVIAVYDITNRMTFTQLSTWLLRAKTQCPDGSPILLVGNKVDWEHQEYGGRVVSVEEAHRFAKEHGCLLVETSAKQNVNVDLAFKGMAKWILAKRKNSLLQISSLQELDNLPKEEAAKKPDVQEKKETVTVEHEYACCYGRC